MKVIGAAADDFEGRVLAEIRAALDPGSTVAHSTRTTPGGRHAAVSLVLEVQTAEEVRTIYTRARQVEGVLLIF
jgi:putative lipoic acid-binding regulatory protein